MEILMEIEDENEPYCCINNKVKCVEIYPGVWL